jgi:hypothetical protein
VSSPVIEKVKRLLALAKSDNEHEAANAMAMAQRLIQQHRLSVAELEAETGNATEQPEIHQETPVISGKRIPKWKVRLFLALARHNGCSHFHHGRRGADKHYVLVGRSSDVENVRFLFAYASSELTRISDLQCGGHGRSYRDSWYHGAVSGIDEQLKRAAESERATATSRALMVLDGRRSEAEALMNKSFDIKTTKVRTRGNMDWGAYRAGKEVGNRMQIKPRKALP